jgi:hypothetical protein
MHCRLLLSASFVFLMSLQSHAAEPTKPSPPSGVAATPVVDLDWHDVTRWGVEGRAWTDQPRHRWFDRLPAAAEEKVTKAVLGFRYTEAPSVTLPLASVSDSNPLSRNRKITLRNRSKLELGPPAIPSLRGSIAGWAGGNLDPELPTPFQDALENPGRSGPIMVVHAVNDEDG